jgi:hypothetical protein
MILYTRRTSKRKPTFKKIQPQAKAVRCAQTGLKLQSRCRKLILTTEPALVIQMKNENEMTVMIMGRQPWITGTQKN